MTDMNGGTGWGNENSGAPFPLVEASARAIRGGQVLGSAAASTRHVVDRKAVAAVTPRGVFCRARSREQPVGTQLEAAGA